MPETTQPTTPPEYDTVCSIGELIDKLSIENCKIMFWNEGILTQRRMAVLELLAAEERDKQIAELEWKVRQSGELRVRLRAAINQRIAQAVRTGSYECLLDGRTYDLRDVPRNEEP